MFYDISQNMDFGNVTTKVPALTRRNMVWSHALNGPMFAEEKLEVQGYPVIAPEQTLGLELPFAAHLVIAYTFAFTKFVEDDLK